MNKTLKTLATLASGMVLLSFVVVVVNQTAGVVQLAKEVNPTSGTATLWGLLMAYGGLIGIPVVILMRMPRPLVPPANDSCPEFDDHLKRLGERLAANPRVRLASIQPVDRRGVDDALRVLDEDATQIVKQMASTVFLTTAVSQSGRFDACSCWPRNHAWCGASPICTISGRRCGRCCTSMPMWRPRRSSPANSMIWSCTR